ncbi:MAG: hypothetical protein ACLFSM_02795 [Thermoplasmata archaeon]
MTEEEKKEIMEKTLTVEESPIKAGGRARISNEVLEDLKIDSGQQVVISSRRKDILVKIYGDNLVDKGKIRLRSLDYKKLDVVEGDEVKVKDHKKLLTKLL